MRHLQAAGLVLGAAVLVGGAAGLAQEAGRPFHVALSGANERPNPGDPDGSGVANLRINPGKNQVCFEIEVRDITLPAAASHIHRGSADVAGPIVVDFVAPDAAGRASGCATPRAGTTAQMIVIYPAAYYVNVHNSDFPPGAVRGQLDRSSPVPKIVPNPHTQD